VKRGAYVVRECGEKSCLVLDSIGAEVSLSVRCTERLEQMGVPVKVVSLPSFALFEQDDEVYRKSVVEGLFRVSVEAASTFGWERYADYSIGLNRFGASGSRAEAVEHFGFTVDDVVRESQMR
jgi:transketolase